jgi:hypothetical protein
MYNEYKQPKGCHFNHLSDLFLICFITSFPSFCINLFISYFIIISILYFLSSLIIFKIT